MCPVPWLKTYCLLHKSEKLSISNLEPSSSCGTALIDWTLSTTLGPRELSIRRLRPLRSVRADGRPRPGIRKMEDSSEQCFLFCCARRSTCWRHAVNQNWEPQYPDELLWNPGAGLLPCQQSWMPNQREPTSSQVQGDHQRERERERKSSLPSKTDVTIASITYSRCDPIWTRILPEAFNAFNWEWLVFHVPERSHWVQNGTWKGNQ